MGDLTQKIISDCFTKQEALTRLLELEHVAQEHFFNQAAISPEQERLLGDVDKDSLDKVFGQVKEEIEGSETLVVYLAGELGQKETRVIGEKAREIFEKDLFLEFKVDPELLGGAALAWKGQYRDYSLKVRLEEKKEELAEVYRKYLS